VPPPQRPAALRGRVFRARDAVATGLLTPDQLRSSAWRRLYRGVYADADLTASYAVRVAGARLLVPPFAVFSGRTAAHLLGAEELVDPEDPVELSIPRGSRFGPVTGLRVRRVLPLGPDEVTRAGSSRCTTGLRTALDIARCEDLPESVVALDVLLARGIVHQHDLREVAAGLAGRGARRAARAIELADPRSESQQESRLRVALVVGGLRPVAQFVVRDPDGRFLARVDLAFPELKVAVEYDGAWHGRAGQLRKDRRRLNDLTRAGWVVLHVTAADMHDQPALVRSVRDLLREAECREVGARQAVRSPTSVQSGPGGGG
jgi:very-short-patch-repair endonuclease